MEEHDEKEHEVARNAHATVVLPANSTPRSLSLLNTPREEDINFPSHLFHESFRKSFLLELDQLCSLAWEISRMEYEDENDEKDENVTFNEKIEVLYTRWNFFDDLYSEHTKCEDLTVFPELNVRVANVTKAYELEHEAEEWLFEEVGGLVKTVWKETNTTFDDGSDERGGGKDDEVNDVDVLATRTNKNDFGKRESIKLVLAKAARGLHATRTMLKAHLAKESAHVLPLLKKHFSEEEQAKMTWSFLEKFPAEKVTGILEWVFGEMMMGEEEHRGGEYLESLEMYLRAPKVKTCAEAMALKSKLKKMIEDVRANNDEEEYERMKERVVKAPILSLLFEKEGGGEEMMTMMNNNKTAAAATPPPPPPNNRNRRNRHKKSASLSSRQKRDKKNKKLPIDHIFQFHDALRVELNRMETEILQLPTDGASSSDAKLVREIEGRFVFLQGVYEAHSKSEDEVVFPQLEKKKALVNVSHSYTLDHEHESELFEEMLSLIEKLKKHVNREILKEEERRTKKNKTNKTTTTTTRNSIRNKKKNRKGDDIEEKNEELEVEELEEDDSGTIVRKLQETCVALKVSLETHVKNEEDELWPLFEEHFTIEEQETLVGLIIGQTGAEVLRAMLDWVRRSLDSEEALVMMANMKQATENTRFAKWLNTWMTGEDPEAVRVLGLKKRGVLTIPEKADLEEKEQKRRKIDATTTTNDNNIDAKKKPSSFAFTAKKQDEEEKRRQKQHEQRHQINNNCREPDEDEISDATTATNTHVLGGHGVRQVSEYFDTLRKSQSADKLLSTSTSVENQSEGGDDTSKDASYSNQTDTGIFKPGWSDIFKMNQRQLESAIHILNRDDTLAPSRKAYLMQNLLASRWITGNQKITEDKMELDAMMVDGGNKNGNNNNATATNNNNNNNNAMRAVSASAKRTTRTTPTRRRTSHRR